MGGFSREVFTRVAWEATLALLGLSQNGPDFGSSMCVVQMYMQQADIYTSYPDPHIDPKMVWPLWGLMHYGMGEHFIFSQHVNTCSWSDWHSFLYCQFLTLSLVHTLQEYALWAEP